MPTATEVRQIAVRNGLAKKRANAIVAVLSGALPAVLLAFYGPPNWQRWVAGLIIGLIWANGVEYAYHRWLLHRPRSSFSEGHREHHARIGTPDEAEHVTLGSSPLNVVILFAVNGLVLIPLNLLLHLRIAPGIFVGWTLYIITAEEIHWRIHMYGWLPPGLRFARAYHFGHHDIPNSRYNIFLPLFDWMLGNTGPRRSRSYRPA